MYQFILFLVFSILFFGNAYASSWSSQNYTDEMTDKKFGIIEAISKQNNKNTQSATILNLICENSSYQLDFFINRLNFNRIKPIITQYRVDNNPLIEIKSTQKHQIPLSMSQQNILQQMQTGKELRVRELYPMGGMSHILRFDLQGFNKAFKQVCSNRQKYRKNFIKQIVLEQKESKKDLDKAMDEILIEDERISSLKEKMNRKKIIKRHKVLINNKIARYINPSLIAKKNSSVSFNIWMIANGTVITVLLTKSSGDSDFDQIINDAILKASPLPVPIKAEIFNQSFKRMPYTYEFKK